MAPMVFFHAMWFHLFPLLAAGSVFVALDEVQRLPGWEGELLSKRRGCLDWETHRNTIGQTGKP